MDRPEFSEVLYRRRVELGVTTSQAARALRLKERVLVAFEEGDWDSMPKSGYAQGMLASYARYLGLDTREIAEMFSSDLEDYLAMRGDDDELLRGPDSTSVVSASGRRRGYSGARGLLPTSGGYAGDMEDFSSVSSARPHSEYGSYGQAMPSAGVGTPLRLVGSNTARADVTSGSQDDYGRERGTRTREGERRYTTRQPGQSGSRSRTRQAGTSSVRVEGRSSDARSTRQRQRAGYRPRVPVEESVEETRPRVRSQRDQVTTRRVADGDYVDDLRYDDRADPYRAASTRSGRLSRRGQTAPVRPNVQRRSRSMQPSRHSGAGLAGLLGDFLANSGNLVLVIVLVAAIILTVIIVSSVSSCVANATSTGRESTSVSQVTEEQQTQSADEPAEGESGESEDSQEGETAEDSTTTTTPVTQTETKVEVTVAVADAGITWVEITLDGQTVVAETKTGPWSATYTVTRSMKIDVSEPSVVTVTRNGAVQTFDSKASGVGTITIDGPVLPEQDEEDTEGDGTTSGQYTVLQYNDDGSWYDQNWYYHDGEGGYYTDDGAYHKE